MNFWITSHWPPRKDGDPDDVASGVWLPDGREGAGHDLKAGDKILVYQARTGRPEIRKKVDGTRITVSCIEGKEGIIAICKALSEVYADDSIEASQYVDGSEIWWRWHAPLKIISKSGFVPRKHMNQLLGYKVGYNLRGFGDLHSGLKKISEVQYNDLVTKFRGEVQPLPIIPSKKPKTKNIGSGGKGGESLEHYLLKHYVASNPSVTLQENGIKTFGVEFPFPTGDRADILLLDHFGRIIGVEIEITVENDQLEGLLQSIKYRYMAELMTDRQSGDSRAILIAYSISEKMKALCSRYDIQHIEVEKQVVKQWSLTKEGDRLKNEYIAQ